MKHIKLFEDFLNENIESEKTLDYFTIKYLNGITKLKTGDTYSDDKPQSLYNFFTYNAGHPTYGFPKSYLIEFGTKISTIIKEAKEYLKNGKFPESLVECLSNWEGENTTKSYVNEADVKENIKNHIDRISKDFKPENKDNTFIIEKVNSLIDILKSWNNPKLLSRINIAANLLKVTSYSAYMGSDFEKTYPHVLKAIKKNKIKITPTSEIIFDKESKITDQSKSSGSGRGDDFIQIDRSSSSNNLNIKVDGEEYFVLSYNTESAYGHY